MRKLTNEELGRMSVDDFHKAEKTPVVFVLDNVRSLLNVGSVFRTADAFRVEAVFLCGMTGTPPHREIQKTALGATETVRWQHFAETTAAIQQLKGEGYQVYAVEQAEKSIALDQFKVERDQKIALVFGNEIDGVQQAVINVCDGCIEIPQAGTKHSLNIAVSVGIVGWEVWKQLRNSG